MKIGVNARIVIETECALYPVLKRANSSWAVTIGLLGAEEADRVVEFFSNISFYFILSNEHIFRKHAA